MFTTEIYLAGCSFTKPYKTLKGARIALTLYFRRPTVRCGYIYNAKKAVIAAVFK